MKYNDLKKRNGLPIAPSMAPNLSFSHIRKKSRVHKRNFLIGFYAIGIGAFATAIAQCLTHMIGFFTNLFFFHRISIEFLEPSEAPTWGYWVIMLPVVGGLIVGLMARFGSKAIRGHGIPEAMEQILTNESKIPWRLIFLKPISAAISIGSGGPFGAEGPIIATGGALGSWLGQVLHVTAMERKTLLASGAAAGMTAIFGSPISAVLLAVELLLFEFRPRSLIPVALASVTAIAIRISITGTVPVFAMPTLGIPTGGSIIFFGLMGIIIGVFAVLITLLVYFIEDSFERLPIHWMWWPALGGGVVGAVGYFFPKTLGVGYINIDMILSGEWTPKFVAIFCLMKLISWSVSLGSGTSGGTLAPLFMIGGGLGTLIGVIGKTLFPWLNLDLKTAALVGMAALFAGASRALLTSIVFAFETTGQPLSLFSLLAGCTVSYVVSSFLMENSIMTEKISRRGVRVPNEYTSDFLDSVIARGFCQKKLVTIGANEKVNTIIQKMDSGDNDFSHQGYPVVDSNGILVGLVTRRDLIHSKSDNGVKIGDLVKRDCIYIFESQSLRVAADLMATENVGRIIVVSGLKDKFIPIGIITRNDLLNAHRVRLSRYNLAKT